MKVDDEDIDPLIRLVYERSGYDFSEYSRASLLRRVNRVLELDRVADMTHFSQLMESEQFLRHFVEEVTVNLTEMFRDPAFYKSLRRDIIPAFADKPFIKIWHAGCSTGEEVYSVAIVLHEAGLLERTRQYATDINPAALEKATSGIFPMDHMKSYSRNYVLSGGEHDFSTYYTANYQHAKFHDYLSKRFLFSTHNLVSDRSFNQFDLIICRNVLIYFNKQLQEHVLRLFDDSLEAGSFLALGSKETIRFSPLSKKYFSIGEQRIWQKLG